MKKFTIIIAMLLLAFSSAAQIITRDFPDVIETNAVFISSGSPHASNLKVSAAIIIGDSEENDQFYLMIQRLDDTYKIPNGSVLLLRTTDNIVIDVTNQTPREDIRKATRYSTGIYHLTLDQFESIGKGVKKLRLQYDGGVQDIIADNDSCWCLLVQLFNKQRELLKAKRKANIRDGF